MQKLLVDMKEAAEMLGVSERSFQEMRRDRSDFPAAVVLGPRRTLFKTKDLEAFVDALPTSRAVQEEPVHLRLALDTKRAA